MYHYLKNLTPTQQIGVLFVIVFGLLLVASAVIFMLSLREHRDDAKAEEWRIEIKSLEGIIKASWFMVIIFWLSWVTGNWVALTLFGLISFFALREFMTLSPTRLGDHRSLVLAFFVILPLQYWLIGSQHYDMFTVFIPVYAFLALPLASALANIRAGDVLMAHLGIWSRQDPWAPAVLEPLIVGLKKRGLCFATLREHPQYQRWVASQASPAGVR